MRAIQRDDFGVDTYHGLPLAEAALSGDRHEHYLGGVRRLRSLFEEVGERALAVYRRMLYSYWL